ncbi:hypothetical protein [Qipengyuania sp.]|uniref:hypothetical protein n=1 Tax=Qipengyuania sp. TaxID=2004515 RepID=UPI0035C84AA8
MIGRFTHFVAIDWSGAKGPRQKGIALAIADAVGGPPVLVRHDWSREAIQAVLRDELPPDTLVGLDLGIALPFADCGAYFPGWDKSPEDARGLWALIDRVASAEANLGANSFVAHPSARPFFRDGTQTGVHFGCDGASHGRGRFRVTEKVQANMGCRPYSNFNLVGAAQVGKSSLTGMRMLHGLHGEIPVWPVDPLPATGSVLVEIYTTLAALEAGRTPGTAKMRSFEELNRSLTTLGSPPVAGRGAIEDHASDALLAAAWLRKVAGDTRRWSPSGLTKDIARTEGWTFGAF